MTYPKIADSFNIIDKMNERLSHRTIVLRDRVIEMFYDELERIYCATYEVPAGGPVCALNIRLVHGLLFMPLR